MGIDDDYIDYDSSHDADVERSTQYQLLEVDPSVRKDIQDKLRKRAVLKTYRDFKGFFGEQQWHLLANSPHYFEGGVKVFENFILAFVTLRRTSGGTIVDEFAPVRVSTLLGDNDLDKPSKH